MSKSVFQYTKEGDFKKEFPSISDAARYFRVNESSIRRACNSHMCCGYYWSGNKKANYFKLAERLTEVELLKFELEKLRKELKGDTDNRYVTKKYGTSSKNGNVLVVADLHLPFTVDGYLEFCLETKKKYNCETVVFIGDIVDLYANSRWVHDSDGMSASDEFKATLDKVKRWYNAFPEAIVTFGNHDTRVFKQAFIAGIPKGWIRSFEEMYNMPVGWKCAECIEIDDVLYIHGDGSNGDMGALNKAKERRQSIVQGHGHSFAGVRFLASHRDTIFGMNVGSAVDEESYSLAYAKFQDRRPVISCGVVLEYGKQPIVVMM